MPKITVMILSAGYMCLYALNFAYAETIGPGDEQADDMILRDYHVVSLESHADMSVHIGLDYSEGDYGSLDKTKMTYMPLSIKYEQEAWSFRISSGYISIKGEENIIPGSGLTTLTDLSVNEPAEGSSNGMGDIFLRGSYALSDLNINNLYVDVSGQVKIPTGSTDKGLSTGQVDLSLQLDVAKMMGLFLPYATIGYSYIGKTERYNLQNVWFASLGISYYLKHDVTLGLSYDFRKSANIGGANLKELQAYVDYQFSENWGGYFYGITGLSDSSPNIGGGFQLKYKY